MPTSEPVATDTGSFSPCSGWGALAQPKQKVHWHGYWKTYFVCSQDLSRRGPYDYWWGSMRTPIWARRGSSDYIRTRQRYFRDGKLEVSTTKTRQKYRNVERDPRVTVTIWDREDPYRFVEVRGLPEEPTTATIAEGQERNPNAPGNPGRPQVDVPEQANRPDRHAPCVQGTAFIEELEGHEVLETGAFDCERVDLMSFLTVDEMGGGFANATGRGSDVWGWTDPETGREYVIAGLEVGTSFVDITDPKRPVYLGNLPSASPQNVIWRWLSPEVSTWVTERNGQIVARAHPRSREWPQLRCPWHRWL
jgi:hypothetical protein